MKLDFKPYRPKKTKLAKVAVTYIPPHPAPVYPLTGLAKTKTITRAEAEEIYRPYKLTDPVSDEIARGMSDINAGLAAIQELEKKRKLNAERQRRYRAKKAGK
jgi:hypothetical protein